MKNHPTWCFHLNHFRSNFAGNKQNQEDFAGNKQTLLFFFLTSFFLDFFKDMGHHGPFHPSSKQKVGGSIFGLLRQRCVLFLMRALSFSWSLGIRWFAAVEENAFQSCFHLRKRPRNQVTAFQNQRSKVYSWCFMLRSLWFSCSLSTAFSGTSWCRSLAALFASSESQRQ